MPSTASGRRDNSEQLFIIDAIAPFFLPGCCAAGSIINWSKAPFSLLERDGAIPAEGLRLLSHVETK
jgi:hypothetical protein